MMVWNGLVGLGVVLVPLTLLTVLGYFLAPFYNKRYSLYCSVETVGDRIVVGWLGNMITLGTVSVIGLGLFMLGWMLSDLGAAITGW